jgi:hypothetical protein
LLRLAGGACIFLPPSLHRWVSSHSNSLLIYTLSLSGMYFYLHMLRDEHQTSGPNNRAALSCMRGNKNINPILLKRCVCVCVCRDFDIFPPPFLLLSLFFLFYKSLIIVVSRFLLEPAHAEGSAPFLGPVYFSSD